jgi:2-(3-amino-3-carboxypropyl)histidine synthase
MSDAGCSVPAFFIRLEIPIDLEKYIVSALHHLKSPVGLLATSQHLGQLAEAKRLLESHGCDVKIGSGSDRIAAPGHVLGCDFSSARDMAQSVSSFLLLGGGKFHSIGVKLITKKPVIVLDPERSEAVIEDIDIEAFLRKRHGLIQRFAEAKTVGVIVSTKPGQRRDHLAEKLKRLLLAENRKAYLLLMDEISPDKLKEIGLDAYVSTACPRIALDDSDSYDMPIATPNELLVALGMLDWDDYTVEEFTHPGRTKRSE